VSRYRSLVPAQEEEVQLIKGSHVVHRVSLACLQCGWPVGAIYDYSIEGDDGAHWSDVPTENGLLMARTGVAMLQCPEPRFVEMTEASPRGSQRRTATPRWTSQFAILYGPTFSSLPGHLPTWCRHHGSCQPVTLGEALGVHATAVEEDALVTIRVAK